MNSILLTVLGSHV